MIYEVRILNPEGKVKKIISGKELIRTHWEHFENQGSTFPHGKKDPFRVPQWAKERLDVQIVSSPF